MKQSPLSYVGGFIQSVEGLDRANIAPPPIYLININKVYNLILQLH